MIVRYVETEKRSRVVKRTTGMVNDLVDDRLGDKYPMENEAKFPNQNMEVGNHVSSQS